MTIARWVGLLEPRRQAIAALETFCSQGTTSLTTIAWESAGIAGARDKQETQQQLCFKLQVQPSKAPERSQTEKF